MKIREYREANKAAVIALWHACGLTRPRNDPEQDNQRKLSVQAASVGKRLIPDD
jgi:hypothetical protein